ncbi:hypothetical protein M513_00127 [Trichuris suis]|uniref:DNA replication complex GINS protein PSF1 n=1 Tax=Trichuris suis TaxID=68888 RepID=A0A085MP18_9BILA|nr:hypothetical protein M513_00127 [Trichuris suis]
MAAPAIDEWNYRCRRTSWPPRRQNSRQVLFDALEFKSPEKFNNHFKYSITKNPYRMNACVHLVEETIREPLQQYQDERLRSIFEEMKNLYDSNKMDVQSAIEGSPELFTIIQDRHCSILRMKRCVIAYLYHRLKEIERLRWTTGGVLPMDVRENLSEMEIEWFQNYSRNLTFYMGSVDPDGFLDLTQNMQPPENLYVRVMSCVFPKSVASQWPTF